MDTIATRLQRARKAAGYVTPTDAARARGWPISTYLGHENGDRNPSRDTAKKYAKAFKVRWEWLLDGDAVLEEDAETVPLVGYVSAGAETRKFADPEGELSRVPAPRDATPETVAVEVRGDSLGPFFDGALIYYDDVRRPITQDLIGKLCIVGLHDDGGVYVKRIEKTPRRGYYDLVPQFGVPMRNVRVEWAARVKSMVPK